MLRIHSGKGYGDPAAVSSAAPRWVRALRAALAVVVLAGVAGLAFAQQGAPVDRLGPDQLRRWAIPERIDSRDFELDTAMVRVLDAAHPEASPRMVVTWLEEVPVVAAEDLDRSQRAWFALGGVDFSERVFLSATPYRAVPAGMNAVRVDGGSGEATGGDAGADSPPSFTFAAGGYYTIVLAPAREDGTDGRNTPPSIHLIEDHPEMPMAGRAGVRVVHVARAVDGADLWTWRADVPRALRPSGGPRGMFEPVPEPLDVAREHLPALSIDLDPRDAYVVLDGPEGFRTQFYGHATLAMLPEGVYTATISRDGFESRTREFTLEASERTEIAILLEEDPSTENARLAGPPPPDRIPPVWSMPMSDVPLLRDVSRDEASAYAFVHAPGYALEIRRAGTFDVLSQIEGTSLEPGGMYSLYVVDGLDDEAIEVALVRDGTWGTWGPQPGADQP